MKRMSEADQTLYKEMEEMDWPKALSRVGGVAWVTKPTQHMYAIMSDYPIAGYLLNATLLCKKVFYNQRYLGIPDLEAPETVQWRHLLVKAECAVCKRRYSGPLMRVKKTECPCVHSDDLNERQKDILSTCLTAYAEVRGIDKVPKSK